MNYYKGKRFVLFKRKCLTCGNEFELVAANDKKFCNQKCYNRHWRKNNPEKINAFRQKRGLSSKSVKELDRYLRHIEPMMNLMGCTVTELKTHLESKFLPGMTWKNHTIFGWHIDHIRPCCSFDLTKPEDQKKCFHYTNLQPLWWKDNLAKSGKHTKMPIRKSA